jgi:hypothetical protein
MAQSTAQRGDPGDQQESAARRPVDTAKVGNVEIAIWRNQGASGDFYTASSPTIRYKDDKSSEWKDGSSYGALDLLSLAEAAREATAKNARKTANAAQNAQLTAQPRGGTLESRSPPPKYFFEIDASASNLSVQSRIRLKGGGSFCA